MLKSVKGRRRRASIKQERRALEAILSVSFYVKDSMNSLKGGRWTYSYSHFRNIIFEIE